jgi:hypothetical protein
MFFDLPVTAALRFQAPKQPRHLEISNLCLEGVGSVHQQADVSKVIHGAEEDEQNTGDTPAHGDNHQQLPIPSTGFLQKGFRHVIA